MTKRFEKNDKYDMLYFKIFDCLMLSDIYEISSHYKVTAEN